MNMLNRQTADYQFVEMRKSHFLPTKTFIDNIYTHIHRSI